MLIIRLQRVGRTNDPSYRIVLVDSHEGPKTGNHVEVLGAYNPKTKERTLDTERVKYWMGKGAQVSPTLWNMLVTMGVVSGKKINVLPKKTVQVKEPTTNGSSVTTETGEGEVSTEASAGKLSEETPAPDTTEASGEEMASTENVVA